MSVLLLRFNRIITLFKEKFEWGFVYNALIGTYPVLIIASCLQFVNMDFTTHINRFSSISALIIGACCFWAPFVVTIALESSAEVLGTEAHEKKHGAFYEGFIVESQRNVSPETAYYRRNFMAFIFLRKITYFSGIVLAYDIPILQMVITCCSGLVLLIFMIKVKPYSNKRDAWMNIGSELLMVLIHLVIFVLAGDNMTQKMSDTQRKNVGWVVIILCCLLVAYNALFIFIEQVLAFWKGLKWLFHFLCKQKKKTSTKTKPTQTQSIKNLALKLQNDTERLQQSPGIRDDQRRKLYTRTTFLIDPNDTKTMPTIVPRLPNRTHKIDLNKLVK